MDSIAGDRLRFHWSLPPSDSWALESAARDAIFESIMQEPVLTNSAEIESALEVARSIPQLTPMVPFRYDAMTAGQVLTLARDRRIFWLLGCARLPFASRGPDGAAPPGWYRESGDFLESLRAASNGSGRAPLHVYGNTAEAAFLAIKYGDCLWRSADHPDEIYASALPILHFGKEVGLVVSLMARPCREEALDSLRRACPGTPAWLGRHLCRCPEWPVNAPILVGSYEDAANAIIGWKRLGISQVLFAAPDSQLEIEHFRRGVLPLTREKEAAGCRKS